MGSFRLFVALLLLAAPVAADQVVYLAQVGEVEQAVDLYRNRKEHDFELLRELAKVIVWRGQFEKAPEAQLMALFGAGIAQDEELLPVLGAAIASRHPRLEGVAVGMLADYHSDEADALLMHAMGSPSPVTRLEAGYHLIRGGHPEAVSQLEAFMCKVVPEAHPLFPQLFAAASDEQGTAVMRRLLADSTPATKRAAVHSLAQNGRDDFLPEIRRMARRLDPLQQEVCALALGQLQDSDSVDRLKRLSRSREPSVAIAAASSLCALGHQSENRLYELAQSANPFALYALTQVEECEEFVAGLLQSNDPVVRLNAALVLLHKRDNRCLSMVRDILITDSRDLGIAVQTSVGGGLVAFKPLPSIHARSKKDPVLVELSTALREQILIQTLELNDRDFLSLAEQILGACQDDLVPTLARLLENKGTPHAFELLERHRQRAGAPLIRGYCNLALFRAGRKGPYAEELREWIASQNKTALLQLREPIPWSKRMKQDTRFQLTAEEKSRLLIESYEALAQRQDLAAIDALLEAIAHGHPNNRYALAGLLLRAIE